MRIHTTKLDRRFSVLTSCRADLAHSLVLTTMAPLFRAGVSTLRHGKLMSSRMWGQCSPVKRMAVCQQPMALNIRFMSSDGIVKENKTRALLDHLETRIKVVGPLTVADYVREVLTNPIAGYYMQGNVFGPQGDFITSPELSQMFGELVGIWHVAQWLAQSKPSQVQLIELGPGKATMMADMLRAMDKFDMADSVSLHLVEASPELKKIQYDTLGCTGSEDDAKGVSALEGKVSVHWHARLEDVPRSDREEYTMIVAHEFFDALPVHQFEYSEGKWAERLVGIKVSDLVGIDESLKRSQLMFTLSPASTASENAAKSLGFLPEAASDGQIVEVCLDAIRVCTEIRRRLLSNSQGGTAMLVDYGNLDINGDTLRAFRDHKEVNIFDSPGKADITADVNFGHLAKYFSLVHPEAKTEGTLELFGPLSQGSFLRAMGIEQRCKKICKTVDAQQANNLKLQVHKLTHSDEMGERFKFALVVGSQQTRPKLPIFESST